MMRSELLVSKQNTTMPTPLACISTATAVAALHARFNIAHATAHPTDESPRHAITIEISMPGSTIFDPIYLTGQSFYPPSPSPVISFFARRSPPSSSSIRHSSPHINAPPNAPANSLSPAPRVSEESLDRIHQLRSHTPWLSRSFARSIIHTPQIASKNQ
eukprot:6188480-Pleurochrysis_carterae.AAC.1